MSACVASVLLSSCGIEAETFPRQEPQSATETVQVRRGSITPVLTLDASLVATPEFVAVAPVSGTVAGVVPRGRQVDQGERVASVGGRAVVAPAAGRVTKNLVPAGSRVAAGVPVAQIQYGGFAASASVPPEAAFRYLTRPTGARVEVLNGPGPSNCRPLQAPGSTPTVLCAIGLSRLLAEGLPALVSLAATTRQDVLYLPVLAVAGRAERGEVLLIDGDSERRVPVKLGATDGVNVEIVRGLREGDEVSAVAPRLSARAP